MGPAREHRSKRGYRILRWLALAAAIGGVGAASAWAASLKSLKYYKATGKNLYPVAIADMNGDGRNDIVVGSEQHKTISILYGKKGGGFTKPHDYKAGPYPFWISIADFNHDHRPDIAVASDKNAGKVVVLLARAGGGYKSSTYKVGSYAFAMAVGDFNGDGNKDLAVANSNSGTVSILLGRHDGTFHSGTTIDVGGSPKAVIAHDFNGDGKPDLAVLSDTPPIGSEVSLFDGRGNGKFKSAGTFDAGAAQPEGMTAGAFSGGHRLDLVVPDCEYVVNGVYVLDGTASGSFSSPNAFINDQGSCSYESAVGDLNADGIPDLVTAVSDGPHKGDVSVMYGEGGGMLSAPHLMKATSPHYNYSIAIGRLNGDKHPDMAIPDYKQPRVAVIYGRPPA